MLLQNKFHHLINFYCFCFKLKTRFHSTTDKCSLIIDNTGPSPVSKKPLPPVRVKSKGQHLDSNPGDLCVRSQNAKHLANLFPYILINGIRSLLEFNMKKKQFTERVILQNTHPVTPFFY